MLQFWRQIHWSGYLLAQKLRCHFQALGKLVSFDCSVISINMVCVKAENSLYILLLWYCSGHTKHKPQLLKYSCQIECRCVIYSFTCTSTCRWWFNVTSLLSRVKPTSTAKVFRRLDQNSTSESQNVELDESIEKREMIGLWFFK